MKDHLRDYLPAIRIKTFIIGGDKDLAYSESLFRETAALIPDAEPVILPGYGHEIEAEHPEQFRLEFLKAM